MPDEQVIQPPIIWSGQPAQSLREQHNINLNFAHALAVHADLAIRQSQSILDRFDAAISRLIAALDSQASYAIFEIPNAEARNEQLVLPDTAVWELRRISVWGKASAAGVPIVTIGGILNTDIVFGASAGRIESYELGMPVPNMVPITLTVTGGAGVWVVLLGFTVRGRS